MELTDTLAVLPPIVIEKVVDATIEDAVAIDLRERDEVWMRGQGGDFGVFLRKTGKGGAQEERCMWSSQDASVS